MDLSARDFTTNILDSFPEWRCFLCNRVFAERNKLRHHVSSHHKTLMESFKDGGMPYLQMCPVCRVGRVHSKQFNSPSAFLQSCFVNVPFHP